MVGAVNQKIQKDLVYGWKNIEVYFQAESARLAVSAEDLLIWRSLDAQSIISTARLGAIPKSSLGIQVVDAEVQKNEAV